MGDRLRWVRVARRSVLDFAVFGWCLSVISASCCADQSVSAMVYGDGGPSLIRFALPLPKGLLREGSTLVADDGKKKIDIAVRPLTWYPAQPGKLRSARSAIVTFPYDFGGPTQHRFRFCRSLAKPNTPVLAAPYTIDQDAVIVRTGQTVLRATPIVPSRTSKSPPTISTIEANRYYLWQRFQFDDEKWPRVIEVRADSTGTVILVAHLQSRGEPYGRAPDVGWQLDTSGLDTLVVHKSGHGGFASLRPPAMASVASGERVDTVLGDARQPVYQVYHPVQRLYRRGSLAVEQPKAGTFLYRYFRCEADEKVPMQQWSWRRAEMVIQPARQRSVMRLLTPSLQTTPSMVDWQAWDSAYSVGPPLQNWAPNFRMRDYLLRHHNMTVRSFAVGDDACNVTGYTDGIDVGSPFGMNRLNHAAPMLWQSVWLNEPSVDEMWPSMLLWCDNFYDLSIWWGPKETGGTRYNNLAAMGQTPPPSDPPFNWRSNSAVSFCTKGFDNFFIAYEQTGDPRYLEALNAQVDYASKYMTAGENYTRNVGCVRDFVNLYKWTGEQRYLDQALRLFRELRTQLSTGDLFTESGKPIEANPPFIENDAQGYQHPFAKPYILGYALEGLPELLKLCPKDPKLREVVTSVADFMVKSQDPVGGWRYPHPRSSYVIMSQAMEHAWQIMQADRVLSNSTSNSTSGFESSSSSSSSHEARLDAIERVLRQRIHGWLATGKIFSGITGWEMATGKVKKQEEIPALYAHPEDRDFTRDYREGRADFGSAPPEGIVYFPEVLRYYLKFRPASRLLRKPTEDEPLGLVLKRH